VPTTSPHPLLRFGQFELDLEAGELRHEGRGVRIPPQPFKLLGLFATQPGKLITREDIRAALWTDDTFIDFEQGVNFAIKQVREALKDDSERPLYVLTVPKRGYKFIAPVQIGAPGPPTVGAGGTRTSLDLKLQKLLWSNVAELRMREERRRARTRVGLIAAAIVAAILTLVILLWPMR
jgi:DNA-binding winged helix-turn-helix (wHTH) protein